MLDYVAHEIRGQYPETGLELRSFVRDGLRSTARFTLTDKEGLSDVENAIDAAYRESMETIRQDREKLFEMVAALYPSVARAGGAAPENGGMKLNHHSISGALTPEKLAEAIESIIQVVIQEPRSAFAHSGKTIIVSILRKLEQDFREGNYNAAAIKVSALAVSLHPIMDRVKSDFDTIRAII